MNRELEHIITLNTTHDVREYFFNAEREEVMEKICQDGDKCKYYTYSVYEFLAGIRIPQVKDAIEKALQETL